MNKFYVSIVAATLLLSGCGEKTETAENAVAATTSVATEVAKTATTATSEAVTTAVDAVADTAKTAVAEVAEKAGVAAEPIKEVANSVVDKVAAVATKAVATVHPKYKGCIGCHGAKGEKVALGKSKVINAMSVEELSVALKGYKDGSYGGPMKGLMKGQVVSLSDDDIAGLSAYIASLK